MSPVNGEGGPDGRQVRHYAHQKLAANAPSGEWAKSIHSRQRDAEQTVRNLGGGEVHIQERDGRWRDSDTVPPGKDPNPPPDRKP